MFQDTLQTAVDTVINVSVDTVIKAADTVATLPTPTSGTELILYWVTLAAGAVSGFAVKALVRVNETVAKLAEPLKLAIIAGVSFLSLQLAVFFGLTLPENPLSWDPTVVTTVISTVFGWVVSKTVIKKEPTSPTLS